MANFTAGGSALDKYDDVIVFPWKMQDLNAMGQFNPARRTVNQNWHAEVGGFSYQNGGMHVNFPPFANNEFSNVDGDIVIMGHGNYGDRIARDSGYMFSARSLARLLADGGLPNNYAGKIIVWSCFAGVPGGAAQSLAFRLQGRGYMGLSVWGCRWITGPIANKSFTCRPNTTPNNVGTDANNAEASLADMNQY
jgi:hypothetical protein